MSCVAAKAIRKPWWRLIDSAASRPSRTTWTKRAPGTASRSRRTTRRLPPDRSTHRSAPRCAASRSSSAPYWRASGAGGRSRHSPSTTSSSASGSSERCGNTTWLIAGKPVAAVKRWAPSRHGYSTSSIATSCRSIRFCRGQRADSSRHTAGPSTTSSENAASTRHPRSVAKENSSEMLAICGCERSICEIMVEPQRPVPTTKTGALTGAPGAPTARPRAAPDTIHNSDSAGRHQAGMDLPPLARPRPRCCRGGTPSARAGTCGRSRCRG